jgi:hypothetical protein
MTLESRLLADQAERIRIESVRLCQHTRQTVRQSENLRADSECLRDELRLTNLEVVERALRAVCASRGTGP